MLFRSQVAVVEGLLAELELDGIPCLKVFNKIDRLAPEDQAELADSAEGVGISALDAHTLPPLLIRAQEILRTVAGKAAVSTANGKRREEEGEG